MSRVEEPITRLQKLAKSQPAADAVLIWFFVWVFAGCGLLWLIAARAFPTYNGAQGVSLLWVGILLSVGGVIAACLCYPHYKFLLGRKQAAINELNNLPSEHRTKEGSVYTGSAQTTNWIATVRNSFITFVVSILGLGFITYLLQSFCC